MPKRKKIAANEPAHSPAAAAALEEFTQGVEQILARLQAAAEQVQELLGRWEEMGREAPGLLGGSLVTLVNEMVLVEQSGMLSERLQAGASNLEELAEHADFYGSTVGEYATLLKVLAGIELEEGDPLSADWDKLSDAMLEHAAALQDRAEALEVALENDGDGEEAVPEAAASAGMATVSRKLLQDVWKRAQAGEKLQGELARLASIMRDHPEYQAAWASDEQHGQHSTQGGVNPFVHVTMHAAVESQLSDGEPAETGQTLERLEGSGMARHDAIHRIANVLVEHLWKMHKESRHFDRVAYVRALKAL